MSKRWVTILVLALVLTWAGMGYLAWGERARPADVKMAAEGDTNFTNVVASGDVTVGDDLIVGDDATVVADFVANTGTITTLLTAADGNFTDDVVIADDLTVKDVVVTTTLTLGAAFTNLRYGMAASVTDGVTITHGLGGAPLFVVITPYGDGITVTANVAVSDTTSFTVDVPDGVTLANLGWFAGK